MSKWRKHVTQATEHLEPPCEGQQIVQAIGSRGSNLIEVKLPDGQQTLCVLPSKFNKKLWVKRGGFLIIEHGEVDPQQSVTGTIVNVLYEKDIHNLQCLPGVWPESFAKQAKAEEDADEGVKLKELEDALPTGDSKPAAADVYEAYSSDDENLPPLRPNTNRPIREYTYSDDETSSEDGA